MAGYSPSTLKHARRLRGEMTDSEKLLWSKIRNQQLGAKFRRQHPIGSFIVDFVCAQSHLIVELDGGQHADNPADLTRDEWLIAQGFRILRFWNHDIIDNLQGALETISAALNTPHPPIAKQWAPPSPSRGEGFMDGDTLG